MDGPRRKDRETLLLERANEQFGLLRYPDLREYGLTPDAINGRIARRRLNRVQHQVYAFGHTALRDEGAWLAALWACTSTDPDRDTTKDPALSHLTVARFHRWPLRPDNDEPVHLSTTGTIRSRDGITVHRTRHLDPVDVHQVGHFRITAIPRTFVDLADVLPWPTYRALADAQRQLHLDKIRQAQQRTPKRPGAPLVTRLIEADDAHTKSVFERRFLRFLDTHQLPRPDGLNVRVAGHTADCHYARPRLVIELDGRAFHARRDQMRADRHRDADYQLSGHRILRLVWDDLHPNEAPRTATTLRRMLATSTAT